MSTPPKASVNGSGKGPEPKSKAAESKALDQQRRWREMSAGLRAIISEMRRVTWPSREEWVSATMVVVGLVIVVALWTRLISFIAEFVFKGGG